MGREGRSEEMEDEEKRKIEVKDERKTKSKEMGAGQNGLHKQKCRKI